METKDTHTDHDTLSAQLNEESKELPPGTLPHDAMNKAVFAHAEVLESFLLNYVGEDFVHELDLSHPEDLPGEFVTEAMRKRFSDSIKKVRWKGEEAYLLLLLEFQTAKDSWIPVRILAYTGLLWLDLIKRSKITREQGLPPIFPIVIHGGSERWEGPLSVQSLLAPHANALKKYQPHNFALLIEERLIKDEILNKNSDFYALYLSLKRAKTPMALRDAINKYRSVLADPDHRELLKTILAILETLYRNLNPDEGTNDVRFASLEEAITTMDTAAINWKENTIKECMSQWKDDTVKEMTPLWKDDTVKEMTPLWKDDTVKKMTQTWKQEFIENNLFDIAKELALRGIDKGEIAAITKFDIEKVDSIFR